MKELNGLSLFANIGIGETYLKELGINIKVANELLADRVTIYKHYHPETDVIQGDINNPEIFDKIVQKSIQHKVNLIIATPPCQGMSIAGKMKADDPRNTLIIKAIKAFKIIKPDYMLIENVPQMLKTSILFEDKIINIKDFISTQIGQEYEVKFNVYDAADYGTPQYRKRTIVRIYKKNLNWSDPQKQPPITVKEAIGDLPTLESEQRSTTHPFHYAKKHNENHILWMKHTPTGKTALNNTIYYPEKDGRKIKGFSTTYKRMEWDKPAPTVTMGNGSVSSQNNVHPGRLLPDGTYSDARVLTLFEIFRIMGLPDNWTPPQDITEAKLRHVIGEAVPPIMMKAMIEPIIKN